MSNDRSDLLTLANEYSDRLTAELEKVKEFLAMANRLNDGGEGIDLGLRHSRVEEDKALELH